MLDELNRILALLKIIPQYFGNIPLAKMYLLLSIPFELITLGIYAISYISSLYRNKKRPPEFKLADLKQMTRLKIWEDEGLTLPPKLLVGDYELKKDVNKDKRFFVIESPLDYNQVVAYEQATNIRKSALKNLGINAILSLMILGLIIAGILTIHYFPVSILIASTISIIFAVKVFLDIKDAIKIMKEKERKLEDIKADIACLGNDLENSDKVAEKKQQCRCLNTEISALNKRINFSIIFIVTSLFGVMGMLFLLVPHLWAVGVVIGGIGTAIYIGAAIFFYGNKILNVLCLVGKGLKFLLQHLINMRKTVAKMCKMCNWLELKIHNFKIRNKPLKQQILEKNNSAVFKIKNAIIRFIRFSCQQTRKCWGQLFCKKTHRYFEGDTYIDIELPDLNSEGDPKPTLLQKVVAFFKACPSKIKEWCTHFINAITGPSKKYRIVEDNTSNLAPINQNLAEIPSVVMPIADTGKGEKNILTVINANDTKPRENVREKTVQCNIPIINLSLVPGHTSDISKPGGELKFQIPTTAKEGSDEEPTIYDWTKPVTYERAVGDNRPKIANKDSIVLRTKNAILRFLYFSWQQIQKWQHKSSRKQPCKNLYNIQYIDIELGEGNNKKLTWRQRFKLFPGEFKTWCKKSVKFVKSWPNKVDSGLKFAAEAIKSWSGKINSKLKYAISAIQSWFSELYCAIKNFSWHDEVCLGKSAWGEVIEAPGCFPDENATSEGDAKIVTENVEGDPKNNDSVSTADIRQRLKIVSANKKTKVSVEDGDVVGKVVDGLRQSVEFINQIEPIASNVNDGLNRFGKVIKSSVIGFADGVNSFSKACNANAMRKKCSKIAEVFDHSTEVANSAASFFDSIYKMKKHITDVFNEKNVQQATERGEEVIKFLTGAKLRDLL